MTKDVFIGQFFTLTEKAEHIVITSHMSPDDDSIGSVLAMRSILVSTYPTKDIRILYTGAPVDRYAVFAGYEHIEWVSDIAEHAAGVDTLITLDASNWRRFTKQHEALVAISTRIGIDHHASEPDDYTLLYKDEKACANVELIYQLFLNGQNLSSDVASYILLGINGDTGGLAYVAPEDSQLFALTGALVEKVGMSLGMFRSRYMGIPIRLMPLLQELVKNTTYQTMDGWPPLQYTFVESIGGYSDEDISAASHIYMGQYLTRVEGYSWGFVITPRTDGSCRMSGRSLEGSVDVRALHEALGIGSGHIRAAGGYFTESDAKVCIQKVLDFMKNNQPVVI